MIKCGNNGTEYVVEGITLVQSMDCYLDRENLPAAIVLCIVYLLLTGLSFLANGRVILLSISERCPELDSLTFVLVTSLSFNQLFISFFLYPLVSYSVIAKSWQLQKLWCWFCALVSSYLYTVYTLHLVILTLDMIVIKFCGVRTLISVSVSKTITLTAWVISLGPQLYPLLFGDTELNYTYDPVESACFENVIFRSLDKFFVCGSIYVLMPLIATAIRYMHLLFSEDDRRNLAATISRRLFEQPTTGVKNFKTSAVLGVMGALTALPWLIFRVVLAGSGAETRAGHVVLSEVLQLLLSLSSVLVPLIYLATCPTYFGRVFPRERFPRLYQLGLGRERRREPSTIIEIKKFETAIRTIDEEGEEEASNDSYIELPAVTINIHAASPDLGNGTATKPNQTKPTATAAVGGRDESSGCSSEGVQLQT